MNDYDLVIVLDDLVVFNDSPTINTINIIPKKLNINTPMKNPITNGKSLYQCFHINNY